MSHKKHQVWAMMPLLGILFLSPDAVTQKYGRHIASAEPAPQVQTEQPKEQVQEPKPVASQTPKLDALLPANEIQGLPSRQAPVNVNADILKEEITSVLSKIHDAESYDRNKVSAEELAKVESTIRDGAIQLVQVERNFKDVIGGEESLGDLPERLRLARVSLEASLGDLEESERVVAARPATPAETPVVATTPAATPEAERKPSVVSEETKPETKPETAEVKPETKPESKPESKPETEEKDPLLCALEEQNKLVNQQLQFLVQQQGLIMQQMMQMSQMMMMQNMYRTPDTFNYREMFPTHTQTAGNWVYYPNGLQPIQPGQTMPGQQDQQSMLLGLNQPQPQMSPYMASMQAPQFPFPQPGMMNQGGMWGLGSQMQFEHPVGNFGMEAMGFNFGNAPAGPTAPMLAAPSARTFGPPS